MAKNENNSPKDIILAKRKKLRDKDSVTSLIRKIIILGLVIYLIFTFVFGFFVVKTEDMFPKMVVSDLALYYRLDRKFLKDDVVVAETPDGLASLRIVAMPGDQVDIKQAGLMINGSYQIENTIYYVTGLLDKGGVKLPLTLGEDEYFLLGDMRIGAKDSRYFGPIKQKDIKGKVFAIYRRANF